MIFILPLVPARLLIAERIDNFPFGGKSCIVPGSELGESFPFSSFFYISCPFLFNLPVVLFFFSFVITNTLFHN